jgi:hypothetical protein
MCMLASDHLPHPCSLPHREQAIKSQVHLEHQSSQFGISFMTPMVDCRMAAAATRPIRWCAGIKLPVCAVWSLRE